MRQILIALVLAAPVLLGQTSGRQAQYATAVSSLTAPSSSPRGEIALRYLAATSGGATADLPGIYLAKEYTTLHNGVTHLVYRQRFQGIEVHNGAWVANIGRDGAILSAGGTIYPEPGAINFAGQVPAATAVRTAVHEVNPRLAASYVPSELSVPDAKALSAAYDTFYKVRYAGGALGGDIEGQLVWFAHRGTLLLAWLFNIVDEDGVSSYNLAIEAATGAIIDKQATTFFQSAYKGLVFDQGSPQPNPKPGERVTSPPGVVERTLVSLAGDPAASPMGWIIDNETRGYNVVVGQNLLGLSFLSAVPRTQGTLGNFIFPLSLGPAAPNPLAFGDAANVNLFYWTNRAHDLFYGYGFNEAAGNFQSNNYGRGGVAGDALLAFTHYGAAAQAGPALNNAFFTARSLNDGGASMIAMYAAVSGPAGFFADGAYAADVIIHEYTHGVSLRLLPNGYSSFQTAAMGEAWSDFFGLEFLLPPGSPLDGSYPVGEYFTQRWGLGIRTRPFSTDTRINPLTYADAGRVIFPGPQVHADGEIWVEALWEARANLIRQFGEVEGRRRIRQLVIDGLMLSVPGPSMIDARDAILLADRVDFEGASQEQLWSAFAKRGMGALAHSDGGDTIHVLSSFDTPSPRGALRFYEDTFVAGEAIRVILSDSNLSGSEVAVQLTTASGDAEDLILRRSGSIFFGRIPVSTFNTASQNGAINIIPGDTVTATYADADSGFFSFLNGAAPVQVTASTQQPYAVVSTTAPPTGLPSFPNETRLTNVRAPVFVSLPFSFPFFSERYRSMVVFPTGALIFEPSVFTRLLRPGCNDIAELSRIAAVAPLFSNLGFGTAQENEGIFMSTPSPNTVAIRWTAETLPQPPAVPESVNVAVTLNSEGVITFYYGSGNQNLQAAAQTLSTCGAQPTVGISNGHDVYARTIAARSYTNAPTLTFYPPFGSASTSEVIIERPAANETVRGVMRVSGIAYEPGLASGLTFVSRRDILIDGVQRASVGSVSRADYCAANPAPGCPFVGYQSELNVAALELAPGRHTVSVRVTNTRGAFKETAPVPFMVDAAPARLPKGAIEGLAAGAELSGTVQLRGYAYADDLRVTRIDLLIDGLSYPGAVYGAARPDICAALAPAPPNCPNVGWTLTLDTRIGTPPLPDGPHAMQLRVLDETGRYTLLDPPIPFTVKNGAQTFPTGALTSIQPNAVLSGIVPVSGYAYSTVGRVLGVILLVDGSGIAAATYGQPRPAECASLPAAACPNIGFSVNLDTRTLTNGSHVIGVRIINDSGLGVTVPSLVRDGMNVVVDNR